MRKMLFCLWLCVLPGLAKAAERWELLATRDVDLTLGEVIVDLKSAKGPQRRTKAIRLLAKDNAITMSNVVIAYSDGSFYSEVRSFNLEQGERSRPIGTSIDTQVAEWVRLEFAKVRGRGARMRLEVWGLVEEIAAKAIVSAVNVCADINVCTPVRIFFGTDRKRVDAPDRIRFGADRAGQLQLGRAIVTVPRSVPRKPGAIPLPSWWDNWLFGVPPGGDPARHFTIPKGGIDVYASAEDFIAAVREQMPNAGEFKDHAFIFVHGYNVSFDDALYRSAQIAYDLGSNGTPFGTAFLFSWPSAADPKYYAYDSDSAREAVDRLQSFVELVVAKSGARQVHLIAHSMGNVSLLGALQKFAGIMPSGVKVGQVILAAPDVDADEFVKLASRIVPLAKAVTLYASSKDVAMDLSRVVHRGTPRAGDVPPLGPVIVNGVDSIDISSISTEVFALSHAEYADRKELLEDIGQLLRLGQRPPSSRTSNYHQFNQGGSVFWRYYE